MPESAVAEVTQTSTPASPAPSSAPSAPVSAPASTATPAISAATPASPTSERPTNIRDLAKTLANLDAKSAATTPSPSTVAQLGAATIAQATPQTNPGEVPSTTLRAEPPKEAWPTILENARTKAVEHFRAQYGITEHFTPERFQKGIGFAHAISENPIKFMNELAASIANDPVWGPQLRSSAGRTLATPAPQRPPAPDVQVINAQGQVVGMTYSAEAQAAKDAYEWNQRKAEMQQTLAPLLKAHKAQEDEKQIAAFQEEVRGGAARGLSQIDEILDGRTSEFGPMVSQVMAQRPDLEPVEAALLVRKQVILPKQAEAAQAQVLDAQLKKANGNTANGRGPVATPMRPKNRTELAAMLAQLEG